MSEWDDFLATSEIAEYGPSDYQLGLYRDYLMDRIDGADIKSLLGDEDREAEFWEEFRIFYNELGDDIDVTLELLKDKIGENTPLRTLDKQRTKIIERKRIPSIPETKAPTTGIPIPQPPIPGTRRGRHETIEKPEQTIGDTVVETINTIVDNTINATIVQPVKWLGRLFGFGRK